MRRILILGGNRFLGPAITERLVHNNDKVTIFNRGNNYNLTINKSARWIKGDRLNIEEINKLRNEKFDIVYDMCAYTPRDIKNSMIVLNKNTQHFVFLSTAAVYEETNIFPIHETAPLGRWDSFGEYGTNKSAVESIYTKWAKKNKKRLTIFRPVYILGKNNYFNRENYYFSRILKKFPILMPSNGNAMIQFTFLEDVAEAFFKIPILQKEQIEVLNLGSDEYITVKGFAELCAKVAQKEITRFIELTKRDGIDEKHFNEELYPFPNISLILSNKKMWKYKIKHTKLEVGLQDIYDDWLKKWDNTVDISNLEKLIISNKHS